MKRLVLFLALAATTVALSSCGTDTIVNTDGRHSGYSSMAVMFEKPAAVAELVDSCEVTITGPDMDPITVPLTVTESTVSGTISNIPAGPDRTFEVNCFDAEGALTYTGSQTIDVPAGSTQTLNIVLYPVDGTGTVIVSGTFADFPDDGGLIVFQADYNGHDDIYSITPQGSGLTRLTDHPGDDQQPELSPDGSRIVFIRRQGGGIPEGGSARAYVMNADGTGEQELSFVPELHIVNCVWSPGGDKILALCVGENHPNTFVYIFDLAAEQADQIQADTSRNWEGDWSPDGDTIVFTSDRTGVFHSYLIDPDGSNLRRLLSSDAYEEHRPKFSPDGSTIAFSGRPAGLYEDWALFTVEADGQGLTVLLNSSIDEYSPAWSPSGSRLLFTQRINPLTGYGLYFVNADGSGVHMLLDTTDIEENPSWR